MVTVLLFAHLQEEAGTDKVEVDAKGMTIGELKGHLQAKYHLTQMDRVMGAVNEEFAMNDDSVKEGDVIALIPPVSGG